MASWEFLDYITEERENPILIWYGTLSPQEQSDFDTLVKTLSETEDWDSSKKKKYKELERTHIGLCELIFKVDGKNLRAIGVLRRESRQFVFLGGCTKFGFWTLPIGAFDKALRLKGQLDQGRGVTREHI